MSNTTYQASINITTEDPLIFSNLSNVSISNAFRNMGKHFESVGIGAVSEAVTVNAGRAVGSDVFTLTSSNFSDADTVTINGTVFVAKTTPSSALQFAIGSYAVASAMNLAAIINSNAATSAVFRAVASQGAAEAGLVTLKVIAPSTTSYSVSKSASSGSWAAATLSGYVGAVSAANIFTVDSSNLSAADTVKIGITTFTAETSGAVGNQFNVGSSSLITGQNLAAAINAYPATSVLFHAVATGTTTGIVTVTVLMPGTIGNQIPVTKSATHGAWTNTTFFVGGLDANIVTLHHGV